MKIRVKFFLMIALLNLIGTLTPLGIILNLNHKRTTELVNNEISNLSEEYAAIIKAWLDSHLAAVSALAQVMDRADKIPPEDRREFFSLMVTSTVESEAEVIGAAMVWEPNALDGLDAELADTPGADHTGRFTPYWSKTRQGVQVETLVGYDIPGEGEYYLIPKQTGKEILTGPFLYPIDGVDMFMATVSAPITRQGRFAGVLTRDIGVELIQEQVEKIQPYPGAVAAVYSNSGIICGHFDAGRLGKRVQDTEESFAGSYLPGLISAIQQGKKFQFTNYSPYLKQEMHFISVPFSVGDGIAPWSLMVGIPSSVISASLYRSLQVGLGICALMMVFIFIGAFLLARSISRPIVHTMRALKDIAEGDLMTPEISVKSTDELGDLARYLNFVVANIKKLVMAIKENADTLSQTGGTLASNMTQTATAVNEITATIKSIQSQSSKQENSIDTTGKVMKEVVKSIETLNQQVEKQSECVTQSSTAVEQMLVNIQQVTRNLLSSEESIRNLSEAAERGRSGLEEVVGNIQEIERESAGILEINGVMENIASQTSLLSMNAAIEAAHAGEAGKGFAVVADEIRKLADSSSEQSKTISGVLQKIKDSIEKITKSTEGVLLKFEAISGGVQEVTNQETQVLQAMEEQGRGSQDILTSIGSLKEISREVAQKTLSVEKGSGEVLKESLNLDQITGEIKDGMHEMVSGAEQINQAVYMVQEISVENKQKIAALMREVSRFKVD
ncbi:MAG: methyl-accepting chemotaxis protein [Treponema sp.]|jgi:methyl-accepting chemotaxis protein|nr:methyl-accepting chemotaxis protein [Treponema sp.]